MNMVVSCFEGVFVIFEIVSIFCFPFLNKFLVLMHSFNIGLTWNTLQLNEKSFFVRGKQPYRVPFTSLPGFCIC